MRIAPFLASCLVAQRNFSEVDEAIGLRFSPICTGARFVQIQTNDQCCPLHARVHRAIPEAGRNPRRIL